MNIASPNIKSAYEMFLLETHTLTATKQANGITPDQNASQTNSDSHHLMSISVGKSHHNASMRKPNGTTNH